MIALLPMVITGLILVAISVSLVFAQKEFKDFLEEHDRIVRHDDPFPPIYKNAKQRDVNSLIYSQLISTVGNRADSNLDAADRRLLSVPFNTTIVERSEGENVIINSEGRSETLNAEVAKNKQGDGHGYPNEDSKTARDRVAR